MPRQLLWRTPQLVHLTGRWLARVSLAPARTGSLFGRWPSVRLPAYPSAGATTTPCRAVPCSFGRGLHTRTQPAQPCVAGRLPGLLVPSSNPTGPHPSRRGFRAALPAAAPASPVAVACSCLFQTLGKTIHKRLRPGLVTSAKLGSRIVPRKLGQTELLSPSSRAARNVNVSRAVRLIGTPSASASCSPAHRC